MRAAWVLLLGSLLSAAPALAQYHGDDDDTPLGDDMTGAVRFHVDTPIVRYASAAYTIEAAGEKVETTLSGFSLGLPTYLLSGFGNLDLGFGYALSNNMVLGTTLQLGYESLGNSDDDAEGATSQITAAFAPYFEYLGGDGGTRPFIGATVFLRYGQLASPGGRGSGGAAEPDQELSDVILGAGLLGGAHFFVTNGCSIDLAAKVTYGIGSTPLDDPPGTDSSVAVFDFLVTIGVSAWMI